MIFQQMGGMENEDIFVSSPESMCGADLGIGSLVQGLTTSTCFYFYTDNNSDIKDGGSNPIQCPRKALSNQKPRTHQLVNTG